MNFFKIKVPPEKMFVIANSSIKLQTIDQNKSRNLKEKIKTIRRAIKQVNNFSKDKDPLLYKSSWKVIYELTSDLRKEIDDHMNDEENVQH